MSERTSAQETPSTICYYLTREKRPSDLLDGYSKLDPVARTKVFWFINYLLLFRGLFLRFFPVA
jgi:hypothetical protein